MSEYRVTEVSAPQSGEMRWRADRVPGIVDPENRVVYLGQPGDFHDDVRQAIWNELAPGPQEATNQVWALPWIEAYADGTFRSGGLGEIEPAVAQSVSEHLDTPLSLSRSWTPAEGSPWKLAAMERMGASVEDLAKETIEEILGYQGEGGHRPPRADIAKLRAAYDLFDRAYETGTVHRMSEPYPAEAEEAQREWTDLYGLNERQIAIVEAYRGLITHGYEPQKAFDQLAYSMYTAGQEEQASPGKYREPAALLLAPDEGTAKKDIGQALKRYEGQNQPRLYKSIRDGLEKLYGEGHASSYKLWPWFVKEMKREFQHQLGYNGSWNVYYNPTTLRPAFNGVDHMVDITSEGGDILARLRAENKLPANMDINKMDFGQFEDWLMEWKRDNRASESQGEVVYQWPDGYTMQRLKTPEQLQYEGDEMGHCVGGYCNQVESGDTLIYSLRDKQGEPHVTMEIEGNGGWKQVGDKPVHEMTEKGDWSDLKNQGFDLAKGNVFPHLENDEDYEHYHRVKAQRGEADQQLQQWYPHYVHQMQYSIAPTDPEAEQQYWNSSGRPWKPEYEVVQVQGNSNNTPKPEYQAKVKEFLDSLRKKGMNFVRSSQWFHNYDEGYPDEGYIENGHELENWWDEYKPEMYRGGEQDAYGMLRDPQSIDMNWETTVEGVLAGLIEGYRREWTYSNMSPQEAAQALFTAGTLRLGTYDSIDAWERPRPQPGGAAPESPKENAARRMQQGVEGAWEQLDEWIQSWEDGNWEYFNKEAIERYHDQGGRFEEQDELDEDEQDYWEPDEHSQPADEDKFMEIRDEITQEAVSEEFGRAVEMLQYLSDLTHTVGPLHRTQLPDKLPQPHEVAAWRESPTLNMPGALSKVAAPAALEAMPDINYVLDYDPEDRAEPGWHSGVRWSPELEATGMRGPGDMDRYYSPQSLTWEQARDWLLEKALDVAKTHLNQDFPPAHQLPVLARDTPYSWNTSGHSSEKGVNDYMDRQGYVAEWFVEPMQGGYRNT